MEKSHSMEVLSSLYKEIVKRIIKSIFLICIWWCIVGFLDNKWLGVKENICLIPVAVWKGVPFLVIFSAVTFLLKNYYLTKYSRIDTQNGITYRPRFYKYQNFTFWTAKYYTLVLLVFVGFRFGELRRTMLVYFLYAMLMVYNYFAEVKVARRRAADLENYTAYLSTMDFPSKHSRFRLQNEWKSKLFDMDSLEMEAVSDKYIKKVGDGLICSYWLYAINAVKNKGQRARLLLILDANFAQLSQQQRNTILQIVDEHLANNRRVLALRPALLAFSEELATAEKQQFFAMDQELLTELRKRHIQIVYDDAADAMILRDFLAGSISDVTLDGTKERMRQLLGLLSQITNKAEEKYKYINYVVSALQTDADMVDNFYSIMRMTEYIFHYRALCELVYNNEKQNRMSHNIESTMGFWMNIQSGGKKKYDGRVVEAYKHISDILNKPAYNRSKVNYAEICSLLTELRNRYIGHGTMAFSVSEEMLIWVLELVLVVAWVFEEDQRTLTVDSVLFDKIPVFYGEIDGTQMKSGLLYVCKGEDQQQLEYLDYMRGDIIAKQKRVYQMDYMGEA